MPHTDDLEQIEKARAFMLEAFARTEMDDHKRISAVAHAVEVAEIVRHTGGSTLEIVAGMLHDVIEDTPVEFEPLYNAFGDDVTDIVIHLTDPHTYKGLSTLERKARQAERIKMIKNPILRAHVETVKVSDQTSNLLRLMRDGAPAHWSPEKPIEWIEGSRAIIEACKHVNAHLREWYWKAYRSAFHKYGTDLAAH